MSTCKQIFEASLLAFILGSACTCAGSAAPTPGQDTAPAPASGAGPLANPGMSKQNVERLVLETLGVMNKAKDVLRMVSAKLPDLVSDNREFRRLDREVELCREEIYPAVASGERLKDNPHLIRDAVRMYVSLRILELRCLRLSDHLATIEGGSQISTQVFDVANRVGRINLRLQPYFLRLVDAYQAETPEGRVEEYMQWQGGPPTQGPVL